jgi:hypothetical protein
MATNEVCDGDGREDDVVDLTARKRVARKDFELLAIDDGKFGPGTERVTVPADPDEEEIVRCGEAACPAAEVERPCRSRFARFDLVQLAGPRVADQPHVSESPRMVRAAKPSDNASPSFEVEDDSCTRRTANVPLAMVSELSERRHVEASCVENQAVQVPGVAVSRCPPFDRCCAVG